MYLYVGKVQVGPLFGYLWLLGNRLYLKLGWRPRDTYFLGNLSDPLSLARRCRDSPRWKIRTWEAEMMILDAASTLAWTWPAAHKALRKELKKLGEEAPV
jgi:hypothetical protein